jgi:hypothetical protein
MFINVWRQIWRGAAGEEEVAIAPLEADGKFLEYVLHAFPHLPYRIGGLQLCHLLEVGGCIGVPCTEGGDGEGDEAEAAEFVSTLPSFSYLPPLAPLPLPRPPPEPPPAGAMGPQAPRRARSRRRSAFGGPTGAVNT